MGISEDRKKKSEEKQASREYDRRRAVAMYTAGYTRADIAESLKIDESSVRSLLGDNRNE